MHCYGPPFKSRRTHLSSAATSSFRWVETLENISEEWAFNELMIYLYFSSSGRHQIFFCLKYVTVNTLDLKILRA